MNRREMLIAGLAIATGASSGVLSSRSQAQSFDVISETLRKRPWTDPEVHSDLRRLSSVLAHLRTVYEGPNGYEGSEDYRRSFGEGWRLVWGRTSQEGFGVVSDIVVPALGGGMADQLEAQMKSRLDDRLDQFQGWLKAIGIAPGSRLQIDLLRAQALFAVGGGLVLAKGQLSFFDDLTWIWPFC